MTLTNPLWDLNRPNWTTLRTATDQGGAAVPALLAELWEQDASDSVRVPNLLLRQLCVSGLLFEASLPAAALLTSMAVAAKTEMKLLGILHVLEELALGEGHESEHRAGNAGLQEDVRQEMRKGSSLYFALLGGTSSPLKAYSLVILSCVEAESPRLSWAIEDLRAASHEPVLEQALFDVYERLGLPQI